MKSMSTLTSSLDHRVIKTAGPLKVIRLFLPSSRSVRREKADFCGLDESLILAVLILPRINYVVHTNGARDNFILDLTQKK